MKKTIEIIVAVRNESDAVNWFVDEIRKLTLPEEVSLQVTFIEDGSTDNTVPVIRSLSKKYPWIHLIGLEKGFGQIPALVFGLKRSTADATILMDVDGTHPISLIPSMIGAYLKGAQIVQGFRHDLTRKGFVRKWGAYFFRSTVFLMTGIDLSKQTVYYRLVSAEYKEKILKDPRSIYFFRIHLPANPPGLVQYLKFDFVDRKMGESKYPLVRLIKFAGTGVLSLITPIRFWLLAGTCLSFVGFLSLCSSYWWGLALLPLGWLIFLYDSMGKNSILRQMKVRNA